MVLYACDFHVHLHLPLLWSNHYHVAKLLLDAGSDVNAKGSLGRTPVHVAAALGFSRILGLFIEQPNCKIDSQVCVYVFYKSEMLTIS